MKTNTKSNLKGIAIVSGLMFIGLLVTGIFNTGNRMNFAHTVQAQEGTKYEAEKSSALFRCSNETLEGRYAVIGGGFVPGGPPPAPMVPFATVSIMTMDGAGNLSNDVTVSRNGQIFRNIDPGTYTLNANCKGTMTIAITEPPFQLNFDLVVADLQGTEQGKEFYFIATTPSVVTHTAKRIQ